jgi:hypothetical protein
MWDHSDDPQHNREIHQDREEREMRDYPGLAEHDAIHEDNGGNNTWGATHRDVVRSDGGGHAHAAERVAHAQSVKDVHGDHSPSTRMPVGDLSAAMNRTLPRVPYPKQEKTKAKPAFEKVNRDVDAISKPPQSPDANLKG